jgi:diguanylate cyclase (GGDEF)-like protein
MDMKRGDLVLKGFADIMQASTRSSNFCGRLGGEEFVIILSQINLDGAGRAIERLRQTLEHEEFNFCRTEMIHVTASFGVAEFQGRNQLPFEELLRLADGALYTAKGNGRNRVEFALEH